MAYTSTLPLNQHGVVITEEGERSNRIFFI